MQFLYQYFRIVRSLYISQYFYVEQAKERRIKRNVLGYGSGAIPNSLLNPIEAVCFRRLPCDVLLLADWLFHAIKFFS